MIPAQRYRRRRASSLKSSAGVDENEGLKRAFQAETLAIETEAATQLLSHAKDELTEVGNVDTLPFQTEIATQLISTEVQHDTQLIHGDMDGTVVTHSDGEGSGDTEVLPDNLDLHCNSPSCKEDDETGFTSRARMLSDKNGQYVRDFGATSALASMTHTDGESEKAEERREGCDSDATTEEVNAEDGHLGGAESVPLDGERLVGEGSLHSNTARQTTHSTSEIENGPSEKALEEFHATANDSHTSQGGLCSLQTPKATLVHDVTNKFSPNMSPLRSRSGSIASVRAASLRASGLQAAARNVTTRGGNDNRYDSDSTIEMTPEMVEELLPRRKALREKGSSRDLMESVSVSFDSITPDMDKSKAETEHINRLPNSKAVVEGHPFTGEKCEIKSFSRRPYGQKVRKLSFDSSKTSDKTSPSEAEHSLAANKEVDGASPATNALGIGESGQNILPEKTMECTHVPRGELSRNLLQHSLPSGFISASNNLSYLESQEPGEESQLNALSVVDRLVWLNATGISQDSEPNIVSQQNCVKASQKAAQSLAHIAEIKNMQDKMGVYDWVDSQQDDIGLPSDAKGDSTRKRKQTGVSKSVKGTAINKGRAAVTLGRKVQLNVKASNQQDQGLEPETLLAGQKRGRRRKEGTGQTQKEENASSLEKCRDGDHNTPTKESSKLLKHDPSIDLCSSHAGDKEQWKRQHALEYGHNGENETLSGSAEEKGKQGSKVDPKSSQTKSSKSGNVKESILTKKGCIKDSAMQETKKYQTRSDKRESTALSKTKGVKRVSWETLGEHQCNTEKEVNTVKEELLEKGPHTRSKAQDQANFLTNSGTDVSCRAQIVTKNDSNWKRKSKMQGKKQDDTSHSYQELRSTDTNAVSLGELIVRKYGLKTKKGDVTQHRSTMNIGTEDTVNEVKGFRKKRCNSSSSLMSDDGQGGSPLYDSINKKDSKRKREAADKTPPQTVGPSKLQSQKCFPKFEVSTSSNVQMELSHHISSKSVPRKRPGSLGAPDSKMRNTMAAIEVESMFVPHNLKNRAPSQKDVDTERELVVPAARTTNSNKKKKIAQHKMIAGSALPTESGSSLILEEGRKRKRERGCICVLFSHSLPEETCKNQKKILAKLGGHVAMSATDCTHFVIDCFVRTRNMLESMAAGKPIVTSLWLESCGQARYFVDEKSYILQDAKKEKELGFSMHSSLAAAQRKPVLQGLNLLVSPKTTPDQEAMTSIIRNAGGQVVESTSSLAKIDSILNGNVLIVIASEEDHEFCLPFIDRGYKVYSTELILSGIVTQNLDFSRNQLFDYPREQKRSSRWASTF